MLSPLSYFFPPFLNPPSILLPVILSLCLIFLQNGITALEVATASNGTKYYNPASHQWTYRDCIEVCEILTRHIEEFAVLQGNHVSALYKSCIKQRSTNVHF